MRTRSSSLATSVAAVSVLALALTTSAADEAAGTGSGTWFDGLEAGICLNDAFDADGNFDFSVSPQIVSCDDAHDNEVVARVALDGNAYPVGDLGATASEACAPRYEAFLGRPIATTLQSEFTVWPSEADWQAGVRDVVCSVFSGEPVYGTAASGGLRAPGETIGAVGEVDGQREVFAIDGTDGTYQQLTSGEFSPALSPPSWTPDGTAVAFASESGADIAIIHLLSIGEAGTRPLVDDRATNDGAAFSPDGSRLAYNSDRESEEFEIYSLEVETGESTRLTEHPDRDTSSNWSPDGRQLAFRRRVDGRSGIWIMNADGSEPTPVSGPGGNDYDPRWSPDGSQLLFTSDRGGDFDIWIMAADGSGATALTNHPADDEYPAWSSDGQFIAFHSDRHGGVSLWLMRTDGSEQSELTGLAPLGYPAFAAASAADR